VRSRFGGRLRLRFNGEDLEKSAVLGGRDVVIAQRRARGRVALAGVLAASEQAHDVADTNAARRSCAVNARDVEIELPHEPAHGRAQCVDGSGAASGCEGLRPVLRASRETAGDFKYV
jgi:hypothetical protein